MTAPRGKPLPTFLVIGAMKSGTTSLYQYLKTHPAIFMSTPKELHFFSHKGGVDLGWYESRFAAAGDAVALGEASASYTTYPDAEGVPARIAAVIPDVRLIYLVRHPLERMRSHYLHRLGEGAEQRPIAQALTEDPVYLRTSQYGYQITRYLEHFPREQILIVQSEQLRIERNAALGRIYRFLDVDDSWVSPTYEREYYRTDSKRVPQPAVHSLRRNPFARVLIDRTPAPLLMAARRFTVRAIQQDRGTISPSLRRTLEDLVRDDARQLRTYIGREFDGWGLI